MNDNIQPDPEPTEDVAGHGFTSGRVAPEETEDVEGHGFTSGR